MPADRWSQASVEAPFSARSVPIRNRRCAEAAHGRNPACQACRQLQLDVVLRAPSSLDRILHFGLGMTDRAYYEQISEDGRFAHYRGLPMLCEAGLQAAEKAGHITPIHAFQLRYLCRMEGLDLIDSVGLLENRKSGGLLAALLGLLRVRRPIRSGGLSSGRIAMFVTRRP